MKNSIITLALAASVALSGVPVSALAAGVGGAGLASSSAASAEGYVVQVKKKGWKKYNKNFNKSYKNRRWRHGHYRSWHRRPHYGNFFAGIVLGTIVAVAIANVPPPRPSSDLCWYWANRSHTRGYWDYCY